MSVNKINYTIEIIKDAFSSIPPLFLHEEAQNIKKTVEEIEKKYDLSPVEVEEIFLKFGKILWPYFESFRELEREYEEKLFEKLLLQKLDSQLKRKYFLLKELGAETRDFISGSFLDSINLEEKVKWKNILLDLKRDIKKFIHNIALYQEEKKYKEKIEKYKKQMIELENHLEELNKMILNLEKQELILEIKDKIKTIENSFIFLAPKTNLEEVKKIKEYYLEKIKDKKFL